MENKDQLNQIPEDSKNESQDEKTSKQVTENVEAPHQTDETPAEEKTADEHVKEINPTAETEKSTTDDAGDQVEEVATLSEEKVADEKEPPVVEQTAVVEEKTIEVSEESIAADQTEEGKIEEAVTANAITEESAEPGNAKETIVDVKDEVSIPEPTGDLVAEEKTNEVKEEPKAARKIQEDKVDEAVTAEAIAEESAEPVKSDEKVDSEEIIVEVKEEPIITDTSDDKEPKITADHLPAEEKVTEAPVEEVEITQEEKEEPLPEEKTELEAVVKEKKDEAVVAESQVTGEADVVDDVVDVEDEHEDEDEEHDEHHDELHDEVDELNRKVDYNEISRDELIVALESLVQVDDVNKIKSRIASIKVSFLKKTKEEKEKRYQSYLGEGGDKEDYHPADDPLEEKFNQLFGIYRQKRSIFLENLEKEKIENLATKKNILEQLKELINSEETLKKTYDDFRTLQESWRQIGMVPKNEVNNLWQNYHFLVEMFFDKVKINKELKDLDLKKNLEQKIVLCEMAEELLLETSILKSFKELQRLHEQWKEIGPAPDDKRDEIWDRFKSATEKINLRRREHYKKLQDEQENNLIAKTALCEKAENLLTEEVDSIKDWQNMTKQFDDLFKVWKSVGPAPKKQNDEIWERFKASLDSFFTDKKEYFGKLKDQQVNNYNLKLDLCVQAEALKDSTEWRNTTRDLINFQKEWRQIGPVPRKHSDKIWKRFRSACDEFFNKKAEHFANQRGEESGNLKKKEDLIKQVEGYDFEGNKGDNLAVLKDFQRQWTEIGFVPFKEKDRLQNTFRDVINKQLDKLNISNVEMSMASYKSRFDVIKDSPDGDRQVYRERTFIQNKVAKLQEDILLWENNLGFLADSKKASLLKQEFEKKIEKAKSEVKVLQAKIKFLNK